MTLPRTQSHDRHWLPSGPQIFLAVLGAVVCWVQMLAWRLSSPGGDVQLQIRLHQSAPHRQYTRHHHQGQGLPVARNGLIMRRQQRSITNIDGEQAKTGTVGSASATAQDKPRVVILSSSLASTHSVRSVKKLSKYKAPKISQQHIWEFERPYYEQCTFMQEWQTTFYPTCNTLHEVEVTDLLSTRGSWRTAWMVESHDQPIVLKMLNLDRHFDDESFFYHQVDAMAMERLTKSKYSMSSYDFCGQSVMVEYAPLEGRDLIKDKRLSNFGRVILGRDISRGISDMHSIDAPFDQNATFVYNDVNIANILASKTGMLKFSDFNIGYPLKWNGTKPCGYPQRWANPLWRSPEEIRNTSYVSEKTDVYSLGNLLYQVMTRHQPWTWLEPNGRPTLEEIAKRKVEGETPFIPRKFENSTNMAYQALYHAIQVCFKQDPEERATASQVARGLAQVVGWMEAGNTSIPISEDLFYQQQGIDNF